MAEIDDEVGVLRGDLGPAHARALDACGFNESAGEVTWRIGEDATGAQLPRLRRGSVSLELGDPRERGVRIVPVDGAAYEGDQHRPQLAALQNAGPIGVAELHAGQLPDLPARLEKLH